MPLDPQVKALLDAAKAAGSPPVHTLSVETARQLRIAQWGQMQAMGVTIAPVANIENRVIPGPGGDLAVRIYTPDGTGPFPIVLYFHGGGFVICNLDTHDMICCNLAAGANCVVVSVDYRLAPEAKFPAAVDDCLAATRWAAENAQSFSGDSTRIVAAGDSAGGNLAAVVPLRIRDEGGPALKGQLLIYPVTDYYDPPTPSYLECATGYGLTRDDMIWFWDHYLNDPSEANNPHAAPLRAADLRNLPPALVITAEYDPLRDEGERYAERLKAAGIPTTLSRYDGVHHAFFGWAGVVDQGTRAVAEACAWLRGVFAQQQQGG